jgi:hypothetical protein
MAQPTPAMIKPPTAPSRPALRARFASGLAGLLVLAAPAAANAQTAYDEAVSGDLSNLGSSPTAISLGLGSNLVLGTTGRSGGVIDRDYFTFTLPAGWQLDTITVLPGTQALGISQLSFIGVQAGTQVTVNPTGNSPAGLLGYWHFGENDIGFDILGVMGVAPGALGFQGALPAGSYAFWVQDSATGVASYRLDFGVSAVPEPAALWLLSAGLGALGLRAAAQRRRPAAAAHR